MNWQNWISILVEWKQSEFNEHKDPNFIKSIDNFSTTRGNILSIAVSIENLIGNNIEYIIFDEQNEWSKLFNDLFLKTSYLWFGNKRKVYKELCKLSSKTKKNYESNKSIIIEIQKCIEIRNKFAHWQFLYKNQEKTFYIEYYSTKSSESIQEKIDTNNLEEIIKIFYDCINNINKLVWIDSTIKTKVEQPKTNNN